MLKKQNKNPTHNKPLFTRSRPQIAVFLEQQRKKLVSVSVELEFILSDGCELYTSDDEQFTV